jgi:benzoyl-CoA reductase subunit C
MSQNEALEALVNRVEALYLDLRFEGARAWKEEHGDRKVIAYLPVYAPIELITAAGFLPLGVMGGGDQLEIIRGDAYFQSYICHIPRSIVELGLSGRLDFVDGFLFPSTCDVIRNLSGIWKLEFPDKYVRYVDVPQDFRPETGGRWWHHELQSMREELGELRGRPIEDEEIRAAIRLHDENRKLMRDVDDLRSERPWLVPTSELYLLRRAGQVMPVEQHSELLREYHALASKADRPMRDHSRIVITGSFCEQPPLDLIKTLERAGCYIVDDDLVLGTRFLLEDVAVKDEGDPLEDLATAFLEKGVHTSFIYIDENEKGKALADSVKDREAEGVIFCAPSFCDPALLDRPMLAKALDERGIAHVGLKYAENTGQFQTIREQAGTFSDALKLWSE